MIITVTTVTTVTTMATMGFTALAGVAVVASLITFLAIKELASTSHHGSSPRIARLYKFVNVAILPLVVAFAVIVAVKIIGITA